MELLAIQTVITIKGAWQSISYFFNTMKLKPDKLVVANWKMNGNNAKIQADLLYYSQNQYTNHKNVILALPAPYLALAHTLMCNNHSAFTLASQDVSFIEQNNGAFTGETSAIMLADCAVQYTLVGHGERRSYNLEDNTATLRAKLSNLTKAAITPIFCIGESQQVRESSEYFSFLQQQLSILNHTEEFSKNLIIAYEPLWAIGTGLTPSISQITEIITKLRNLMQHYRPFCDKIRILYGGSVNPNNISDIMQIEGIAGVLVGGSALDTKQFTAICHSMQFDR